MNKAIIIFLSILLLPCFAHAAVKGTPEWIVESFFIVKEFPEKEKYYVDEMLNFLKEANMGSRRTGNIRKTYRLVAEKENKKNYAIKYYDNQYSEDWYCYIKKDKGIWKLSAVRTLASTGPLKVAISSLSKKNNRNEEEEYMYQNILLTLSSDDNIKKYLVKNINKFRELKQNFNKNNCLLMVNYEKKDGRKEMCNFAKDDEIVKKAKGLHLNYVTRLQKNKEVVDFNIGGIIDNSVGFLYIPDGVKSPEMGAISDIMNIEIIYLEEVMPNWYIYKTS